MAGNKMKLNEGYQAKLKAKRKQRQTMQNNAKRSKRNRT